MTEAPALPIVNGRISFLWECPKCYVTNEADPVADEPNDLPGKTAVMSPASVKCSGCKSRYHLSIGEVEDDCPAPVGA